MKWLKITLLIIVAVLFSSQVLAVWDYTDELLHYYNLDDSGNTILDQYGTNNLTNNGANASVSGLVGTAYAFGGEASTDYMESLENLAISGSQNRAISVWFKTSSADNNDHRIVATGQSTALDQFSIYINDLNTYRVACSSCYRSWDTPANINNNSWNHIVVSLNGTDSSDIVTYYNGVELAQAGINDQTLTTALDTIKVGVSVDILGVSHFQGDIDEIAIWNKSLTLEEAKYIYSNGTQGYALDSMSEGSTPSVVMNVTLLNNTLETNETNIRLYWNVTGNLTSYTCYSAYNDSALGNPRIWNISTTNASMDSVEINLTTNANYTFEVSCFNPLWGTEYKDLIYISQYTPPPMTLTINNYEVEWVIIGHPSGLGTTIQLSLDNATSWTSIEAFPYMGTIGSTFSYTSFLNGSTTYYIRGMDTVTSWGYTEVTTKKGGLTEMEIINIIEMIAVILILTFTHQVIYKKNRLVGNIIFMLTGLGVMTISLGSSNVISAMGMILTLGSLINLFYDLMR